MVGSWDSAPASSRPGTGPKYVNSPASVVYSKAELLFGAHHARASAAKIGTVVLVEGYVDALAMHQAGIDNAVALMGTAISEHQVAALKRLARTVVLMLEGDEAGTKAILRAGTLAGHADLTAFVAPLPPGCDPADLMQRDGVHRLHELVERSHTFAH